MKRSVRKPTKEDMLALIAQHFPDIAIQHVHLNTDGWDHAVLIINNEQVFRFPLDEEYEQQLAREIQILIKLSPLVEANIPQYNYVPNDSRFAGYNLLPGEAISKQLYDSFSDTQKTAFAKHIAQFLTQLHTAPLAKFPQLPKWFLYEDQPNLKMSVAKYLPSKLTASEMERVHAILNEIDTLLELKIPQVFIHNDLYSRHILWDATPEQLSIIDFSDMCLGDPAVDFNELHEYGKDFVTQVYELYEGPKDSTFLDRAWQYQKWTGVFMLADHFINDKTTWHEAREIFDHTH